MSEQRRLDEIVIMRQKFATQLSTRKRHDSDSSSNSGRFYSEAMPINRFGKDDDVLNRNNSYRLAASTDNAYIMRGCLHCHNPCIDLAVSDLDQIFCSGECRLSHMFEEGRTLMEDMKPQSN